jgi:hypothetical protein
LKDEHTTNQEDVHHFLGVQCARGEGSRNAGEVGGRRRKKKKTKTKTKETNTSLLDAKSSS